MPRVLFVSNGHGEDTVACRIADRLLAAGPRAPEVEAWPMVGTGDAYRRRGIPVRGEPNLLPSEGFATLSASMLARDLRAGWIGTHLRQVRHARSIRGKFDLVVAVGDVVPMAAAALARTPFVFVGCAKSEYYGARFGYTASERWLLRTRASITFPRDRLTADALERHGVPVRYVGNPMMDELADGGEHFGLPLGATVIGCLPGSRRDGRENALRMLELLAPTADRGAQASSGSLARGAGGPWHLLFALPDSVGGAEIASAACARSAGPWRACPGRAPITTPAVEALLAADDGSTARFTRGRIADVLHRSQVVVGLAGTANEQAVGLGRPLVTFATGGVQGEAFVRMKRRYFGEAALESPAEPRALRATIVRALGDEKLRRRMAAAGRERMGGPGASDAISAHILERLA